jgi:hypothetical protein
MPKVKTARVNTKVKKLPARCLACEKTGIRADVPECWKPIMQSDKIKRKEYTNSICFACMNNNGYTGHTTDEKKYYIKRYEILDQEARDAIWRSGHTKKTSKSYCALVFHIGDKFIPCCQAQ